ncbi:MAG TPA: type VI secretion protein ImpB, partial [Candidatus Babeliaceae bacterium]|nr:type VI secretion protein ImpB [Candidatus Babeliaceae bacterium]
MNRFFLVDCNNFFVSCERLFNPKLNNKPVVVLSSNDSCVIARSNEAKTLGIAMGAPAFECIEIFKKHNVITYSANFGLYCDMSSRVMKTLADYATDIEVYSIDEAFLFVAKPIEPATYLSEGYFIKKKVAQATGIPVSIGIGPTKTLAKIATRLAKKSPSYKGVFDITNHPEID